MIYIYIYIYIYIAPSKQSHRPPVRTRLPRVHDPTGHNIHRPPVRTRLIRVHDPTVIITIAAVDGWLGAIFKTAMACGGKTNACGVMRWRLRRRRCVVAYVLVVELSAFFFFVVSLLTQPAVLFAVPSPALFFFAAALETFHKRISLFEGVQPRVSRSA